MASTQNNSGTWATPGLRAVKKKRSEFIRALQPFAQEFGSIQKQHDEIAAYVRPYLFDLPLHAAPEGSSKAPQKAFDWYQDYIGNYIFSPNASSLKAQSIRAVRDDFARKAFNELEVISTKEYNPFYLQRVLDDMRQSNKVPSAIIEKLEAYVTKFETDFKTMHDSAVALVAQWKPQIERFNPPQGRQ